MASDEQATAVRAAYGHVVGKWKRTKAENLDEELKAQGFGFMHAAHATSAACRFTHATERERRTSVALTRLLAAVPRGLDGARAQHA